MEFERVGGTKKLKSDFRIISATNHNLSQSIKKGLFRQDLYFRLNTVPIELPPLRERREDIPLLISHFIQIYSRKTNKAIRGGTPELLSVLENYSWPGNVRELKNAIEHAFVYCREDTLGIQHLPRHICDPDPEGLDLSTLPTRSLAEVEQRLIELSLWENRGNKTKAAQALGINRTTLLSKMRIYGLASDDAKDPTDEN
jgi:DNA-binding NtrC family response regulator